MKSQSLVPLAGLALVVMMIARVRVWPCFGGLGGHAGLAVLNHLRVTVRRRDEEETKMDRVQLSRW